VERVRRLAFGEAAVHQPVGVDGRRDVVGLERNDDVLVAQVFEDLDVPERALDHRLGGVPQALLEVARERSHVDADPDRRPALQREFDDFLGLVRIGDVPGVQSQLGDAGIDRGEGHAVIEVDVGDDRHRRALHDVRQARGVARVLTGDADDLAAGHREAVHLLQRLFIVGSIGRRHRLHGDRMAAADPDTLRIGLVAAVLQEHGPRRAP
jgi:hypothetical protein